MERHAMEIVSAATAGGCPGRRRVRDSDRRLCHAMVRLRLLPFVSRYSVASPQYEKRHLALYKLCSQAALHKGGGVVAI